MRSLEQIKDIKDKTVIVRVDFNVPIKNDEVEDDFKIRAALPTINFLLKKGAKIILVTHLGKSLSASGGMVANLEPVIQRFWEVAKFKKDRIEFFENARKFPGEEKNDPVFAKKLARLGDIYVNDAFSVSHREHASIVLLPKLLPSYAGFQLEKEIKNLSRAFEKPKHPFLFILGGAKFSTKIPLIEKYLKLADQVFVGGALAHNFFRAKGYEVGQSFINDPNYEIKKLFKNEKLILPVDVIVRSGNKLINKRANQVGKNEIILDIGAETVKNLASMIKKSKFILWNGPLGKYEDKGGKATKQVLEFVLKSKAEIIIGGGDIVSVFSSLKPSSSQLEPNLFVSTGGGATLDFLANGTLPGIKALLR
ncbi:phosphoglycerate kinase [Candidatus Nomurabacteria bacterium]|nr:phosphoglycerate kinase [Candidatus Nomurabacteria bacterium]